MTFDRYHRVLTKRTALGLLVRGFSHVWDGIRHN